jgi:trehalose 6-phosphate phosphatase
MNVVIASAPDKADAVASLVRRCGASRAVFLGDDVNDEPVFATAPGEWLTVKIGREPASSQARFYLESPDEVALLLDRMLALVASSDRTPG